MPEWGHDMIAFEMIHITIDANDLSEVEEILAEAGIMYGTDGAV